MSAGKSITPDHIKSIERLFAGVREIVDHPDQVVVRVIPAGYNAIVQLETDPSDVGVVIGCEGHVISSLRSLLSVLAGKHRLKLVLEYKTEKDRNAERGNERGADRGWRDRFWRRESRGEGGRRE
jgi:predicted RNA-binding protein YlqC (UPF0109 family)